MNHIVLNVVKFDGEELLFKPHHKVLINVDEIGCIEEDIYDHISKVWFKRSDMYVLVAESLNTIISLIKGPQPYVPSSLDEDL